MNRSGDDSGLLKTLNISDLKSSDFGDAWLAPPQHTPARQKGVEPATIALHSHPQKTQANVEHHAHASAPGGSNMEHNVRKHMVINVVKITPQTVPSYS